MAQVKIEAVVKSQEMLADGVYSMVLSAPEIARQAKAGQFVSVYTKDSSRLLPRPISLCGIDKEKGELRLVYRVAGAGTEEFSRYEAGEKVQVMGPLGNGFPLKEKKAILIGGGIGIPPMLGLMKALDCERTAVLGYRDSQLFLKDEFEAFGPVSVATEDGSAGTKGNVLDAIRANGVEGAVIYACGPTPMLRAIKAYAAENGIECYISLEERMACGIGACLACVCQSKEVDHHSNVHNKRICKDGPVFAAEEVEI
ncbi:dihydroorotate dehydrogenase electron transfer subunit [Lachnoclostridium sp. An14]|uniref:dihydroorotate dehydrogenase electron transfer subunit n=1 Tax=Lachnoclostridium sp. An14 TaxID=1965562 RepID=UPI000B3994DD|nr:dihydroorotate dehydrogenase electron transfer subunit [Lachnoclostridium sp. An14]OUQ15336.1 dihydroorotate dehydrogenase electron transfer subunit [Lachnoclostridium sp. An14]